MINIIVDKNKIKCEVDIETKAVCRQFGRLFSTPYINTDYEDLFKIAQIYAKF
jgi:hypothetical protein